MLFLIIFRPLFLKVDCNLWMLLLMPFITFLVISQIELLCWKADTVKEKRIKDFIADSTIYDITPDVITHCVKIRRNKKAKTPDAIIAATALSHGFTLITNNEKDFKNIKGLKIINPFKV